MPSDPKGPEQREGPEVLDTSEPPAYLRPLLVALVVLAVVAAGVWAEGVRRAPDERRALAACAEEAVAAVDLAERRLAAMAGYIAPGFSADFPTRGPALLELVSGQAASTVGRVEEARGLCQDAALWPTSTARRQARAALLALLEAEQRRLERIVAFGGAYYSGYEAVRDLRDRAVEAVADAAPGALPAE